MSWIEDIKEPAELTIIEIVGLVIFCGMLATTNNFNLSLFSMILCVGFMGVVSSIIRSDYLFIKKVKLI